MRQETLLILSILAVWRFTSLISREMGPYSILFRFRKWAGVKYDDQGQIAARNELALGLICPWCSSVWWGIGLAILQFGVSMQTILIGLAYSAGAIIIDELIQAWE